MSRIRSIHPGLWTDEAFVTLSAHARLFFMGLWNECDDLGSFEWSPLKLKMRLAPADAVDGAALLAEIEQAGCIMAYDEGGKRYGAVRNFCKYQRPKKPSQVHPQTEAVREWVGTQARSTRDGGEAVGNQLPTGGEKCRQMEEEGGRRGKEKEKKEGDAADAASPNLVFEGSVIRLTRPDFERWRSTYSAIPDFAAELTALDAWFQGNPEKQKRWFHTASGALNRKHQEILTAQRAHDFADGPLC